MIFIWHNLSIEHDKELRGVLFPIVKKSFWLVLAKYSEFVTQTKNFFCFNLNMETPIEIVHTIRRVTFTKKLTILFLIKSFMIYSVI